MLQVKDRTCEFQISLAYIASLIATHKHTDEQTPQTSAQGGEVSLLIYVSDLREPGGQKRKRKEEKKSDRRCLLAVRNKEGEGEQT